MLPVAIIIPFAVLAVRKRPLADAGQRIWQLHIAQTVEPAERAVKGYL